KGAQRHQLTVRSLNVSSFQLTGIESLDAFELRDDLVASAVQAEAVDEIAAHKRGQIRADSGHIQAKSGDLIAVHHQLDLGLIDFRINYRWEGKNAAGGCLLLQVCRKLQNLVRFSCATNHKLDGELAAAWQRGRANHHCTDAGNL